MKSEPQVFFLRLTLTIAPPKQKHNVHQAHLAQATRMQVI